jgi:5'-3' exonuclease
MKWLFIDGSYYIFYRFYALHIWWKNARKDEPLENPIENSEFVEKFEKTFKTKIEEFKKKLNIEDAYVVVGKDCPRKEIWRMDYLKEYKGTRKTDDTFLGGPFFKIAYDYLYEDADVDKIIEHENLEADDCIALCVHHILEQTPDDEIYIIASDHDYLQLLYNDNIQIFDLKYKSLKEHKNVFEEREKNLFCKIVMGDKSDNIPAIFPKCGLKTSIKCWEDKEFFENKMNKNEIKERFEKNQQLIDFHHIPDKLVQSFQYSVLNDLI